MSVISISSRSRASGGDAGGMLHGLDDVLVAGASADVALEMLAELGFGGLRVLGAQGDHGDHGSRGAEAALQAMAVAEGFLDGGQLVAVGEALDGRDRTSVVLQRQDGA